MSENNSDNDLGREYDQKAWADWFVDGDMIDYDDAQPSNSSIIVPNLSSDWSNTALREVIDNSTAPPVRELNDDESFQLTPPKTGDLDPGSEFDLDLDSVEDVVSDDDLDPEPEEDYDEDPDAFRITGTHSAPFNPEEEPEDEHTARRRAELEAELAALTAEEKRAREEEFEEEKADRTRRQREEELERALNDIDADMPSDANNSSAGYDLEPENLAERIARRMNGIEDKGGYYKIKPAKDEKAFMAQMKKAILAEVLVKGHTTIHCYKGNDIDPQMTQVAQKLVKEMSAPGGLLDGRGVSVADQPMYNREPWKHNIGFRQANSDYREAVRMAKLDKKNAIAKAKELKSVLKQELKLSKRFSDAVDPRAGIEAQLAQLNERIKQPTKERAREIIDNEMRIEKGLEPLGKPAEEHKVTGTYDEPVQTEASSAEASSASPVGTAP